MILAVAFPAPHTLPPWPMDVLAPGDGAVLLMTGALNPIHLGHVAMMEQARALVTARGERVLGGWMSPSNDHYVQPKYRRKRSRAWPAAARLAMCQAAVAEHGWLGCAAWEASVPDRWPDFPEVVDVAHAWLTARRPGSVIYYVCGADHHKHLSQGLGHPGKRVIVVPRGRVPAGNAGVGVFVAPADAATRHVSATMVREALASGAALDGLLHPAVAGMVGEG